MLIYFAEEQERGKAQPLDSLIFTKNGYKRMGDIQKGDIIIDGLGKETVVEDIFPQGKKPIYKITFSDRTSVKCSDEHLWKVTEYGHKIKEKVLTLNEIIDNMKRNKNKKYRIPIPVIDVWEDNNLSLDPYLLGFLLGDGDLGSSKSIKVSIYEEDIKQKLEAILNKIGYKLNKIGNNSQKDYNIVEISYVNSNQYTEKTGFKQYIDNLNINKKSIEKHIPRQYLYASVNIRIKLLQGLFDSDGWVCNNGKARSILIYNTSSPRLSEDFAFLVRSLGGTDTVIRKKAGYKVDGIFKRCNDTYQHTIKFSTDILPFSSKKHIEKYKEPQNKAIRRIDKIEYLGEEECQCIKVASEDHTYITDNLTVTHNTTTARIIASMINNGKGSPIELDCASHNRGR